MEQKKSVPNNSNMTSTTIVDLSPFFTEGNYEGQKKAKDMISQASSECGFFQILNHGIPLDLMNKAMELSTTFFKYPHHQKLKFSPQPGSYPPAGYTKNPAYSTDHNEILLMVPPGSSFNVIPTDPPELQETLENLFTFFTKTGQLLETILNDCLGLPPNFLQEYNDCRNSDFMVIHHYFLAAESKNIGLREHQDPNLFTFILQDEVGGLQVRKDGEWNPVKPIRDALVVNISDIIQVLSNDKFKSPVHRVISSKGRERCSFAFFYNISGEKWVEPLPKFTEAIGEFPKYRGFLYKDYQALRLRNKIHPPSTPEDVIHITHYAIQT